MIDFIKMIDIGMWSVPAIMSGLDRMMTSIGMSRIFEKTTIVEEIVTTIGTNPITTISVLQTTRVDKPNRRTMGATGNLGTLAYKMTTWMMTIRGHRITTTVITAENPIIHTTININRCREDFR